MANLLYNLAQPFSDTKQYTQGAIVIYNDRMYEMTADEYTPGAFDLEKFTERFLSEMISGKVNSNLSKKLFENKGFDSITDASSNGAKYIWDLSMYLDDVTKYTIDNFIVSINNMYSNSNIPSKNWTYVYNNTNGQLILDIPVIVSGWDSSHMLITVYKI